MTLAELPEVIRQSQDGESGQETGILKEAERDAIAAVLKRTAGNRRLAADRLGISRRTLQYRLKEYGLVDSDIAE